jgi:hypothetical protein
VIHLVVTTRVRKRGESVIWSDLALPAQAGVAALLILGIICARSVVTSEFIYFQF